MMSLVGNIILIEPKRVRPNFLAHIVNKLLGQIHEQVSRGLPSMQSVGLYYMGCAELQWIGVSGLVPGLGLVYGLEAANARFLPICLEPWRIDAQNICLEPSSDHGRSLI